ncbi:hypothetical protein GCM10027199_72140 [Amycolatopsis magusensis]
MKKSYHSIVVPTRLAPTTRRSCAGLVGTVLGLSVIGSPFPASGDNQRFDYRGTYGTTAGNASDLGHISRSGG